MCVDVDSFLYEVLVAYYVKVVDCCMQADVTVGLIGTCFGCTFAVRADGWLLVLCVGVSFSCCVGVWIVECWLLSLGFW